MRKSYMNQDERDLLIRIDENLKNFTKILEVHILADIEGFRKQGIDIDFLKKTVFMGIGGLMVLQFILRFFVK